MDRVQARDGLRSHRRADRGCDDRAELEQVYAVTERAQLHGQVTDVHLQGGLRCRDEPGVVEERVVEHVGEGKKASAGGEEIELVERLPPVGERVGEMVEGLLELPRGEGVAARGEEATERGAGDRVYEEAGAALTGDLLERVRAGPRAGCGAGVRPVKDDAAADHANVLLDPARV